MLFSFHDLGLRKWSRPLSNFRISLQGYKCQKREESTHSELL